MFGPCGFSSLYVSIAEYNEHAVRAPDSWLMRHVTVEGKKHSLSILYNCLGIVQQDMLLYLLRF